MIIFLHHSFVYNSIASLHQPLVLALVLNDITELEIHVYTSTK